MKTGSKELLTRAEELLAPQVESTAQPIPTAGTGAEMFKPQSNLKPSFLDKQASHLEVQKFCQGADVYIKTGFRDTPPQGIWPYLRPLMHITWSNALELSGVKEKFLAETLDMLLAESQLRNPVHNLSIDFLASKRGGMAHSDLFDILEEKLSLIEFGKLTPDSLLTHIFLQEADVTMTKAASEILYVINGKGDTAKLRNEIKSIEASQWYDSKKILGKKAGDHGIRWCEKCQSRSHDTDGCWGACKICGKIGHLAAVCWKNPANAGGAGAGAAKSVM